MYRLILSKILLPVFFLLSGWQLFGQQASITLEPEKILIGEHAILSFEIEVPRHSLVEMPVFNEMLNEKIEILHYGNTDTLASESGNDFLRIKRSMRITSWEEGFHPIAPLEFLITEGADTLYLETEALLLEVDTFSIEEHTDLKDVKPLLKAPVTIAELKYYIHYILGFILLVVIIWLLIRYIRKRKKQPEPESVWEKPDVPAHIAAIGSLEKLKAQKLWQQGKVKEYYIILTDIIRHYVEKRFGVGAMEMTTLEIMSAMRNKPEMEQNGENLQWLLQQADLVKFAKYQPSPTENESSMDMAFEFVNNTRQLIQKLQKDKPDSEQ